jgi:hypothetical protein
MLLIEGAHAGQTQAIDWCGGSVSTLLLSTPYLRMPSVTRTTLHAGVAATHHGVLPHVEHAIPDTLLTPCSHLITNSRPMCYE